MKKNKKKGFTLVELLAVIVVLAIILVIAVPKILDVIKSSRENSLISSIKLIARNAEQKLLTNEVLGENTDTLSCAEVADINTTDYKSCNIDINEETKEVTVTIEGKGKFSGYTCSGTKNNVTCGEENTDTACVNGRWGYKYEYSRKESVSIETCTSDLGAILADAAGAPVGIMEPVTQAVCTGDDAVEEMFDSGGIHTISDFFEMALPMYGLSYEDIDDYFDRVQGEEICNADAPTGAFAEDSWATIKANVSDTKYHVGDMKCVNLNGYTSTNNNGCNGGFLVRIANKSTPSECSIEDFSETACGFVVEFVDIIDNHVMNEAATNIGGYPGSDMYDYINNDIYNALPSELKNVMIDTTMISGHGKNDANGTGPEGNYVSTDRLYLLTAHEVWEDGTEDPVPVSDYDTGYNYTRQLDYYGNNNVTTDNNYTVAIKKYSNKPSWWWLGGAYSSYPHSFLSVSSIGIWDYGNATYGHGVSPAFRLDSLLEETK